MVIFILFLLVCFFFFFRTKLLAAYTYVCICTYTKEVGTFERILCGPFIYIRHDTEQVSSRQRQELQVTNFL